MKAKKLFVRNFRCFASKTLQMDTDQIIIQGRNGAGKSTLLEALNYACYAHSFRTRKSEELAKSGAKFFYIELITEDNEGESHKIQIGYDTTKRGTKAKSVKLNGKPARATSEILRLFRTVSITSDDLELVKGSPEIRRNFLNQTLFLLNNEWNKTIRSFKKILSQRNALLWAGNPNRESLKTWTKQLWGKTVEIQLQRESALCDIEFEANRLLQEHFTDHNLSITLRYQRKKTVKGESFEDFWVQLCATGTTDREIILKRSSFGAHLDDFETTIFARCARTFASRGEQKLITLLLKCSQLNVSNKAYKNRGILLLDDFLTDLDQQRLKQCIELLQSLKTQIIITCPLDWNTLTKNEGNIQTVKL
ncbi:DNA replication/repair protein RecF [Candidatus Babeliales bacterium]|nr:DNA replication/repair protein RecF [Candidatus Babeliales bacterium]